MYVAVVVAAFLGVAACSVWWEQPRAALAERGVPVRAATATPATTETVGVLRAQGSLDPGSLGGGDVVVVDGTALRSDASPFEEGEEVEAVHSITWYVVKEGDSLSQVAAMFGVSANTIVWANELSSRNDLHPGMRLLILPIDGVQHTVASGDTLERIAKRYGGDAEEIRSYNDLVGGELALGMVLTVPGGEIPAPRTVAAPKARLVRGGGAAIPGYFFHPLPGSVRTQGLHGFNGIDFAAPEGTPILAAAAGTVIVLKSGGWNGGYGTYLVVSHPNGTETLYAHLSGVAVAAGDQVAQGEAIGYVGSTGRSTGNHLHFEIRGAANPF